VATLHWELSLSRWAAVVVQRVIQLPPRLQKQVALAEVVRVKPERLLLQALPARAIRVERVAVAPAVAVAVVVAQAARALQAPVHPGLVMVARVWPVTSQAAQPISAAAAAADQKTTRPSRQAMALVVWVVAVQVD
jgi:hypothetical protein